MGLIMKQAITGPAAWKGADKAGDTSWLHHLSDPILAKLDAALAHVQAQGFTFPHFGKEDFPIGDWAQQLHAYSDELENGRGFLVLRGLPVERYSEEQIQILYYGIGLHMEPTHVLEECRGDEASAAEAGVQPDYCQPLVGGAALQAWIENAPNDLYSALTYQGGGAWRERLMADLAGDKAALKLVAGYADEDLALVMTELGGHCLETVLEAFEEAARDDHAGAKCLPSLWRGCGRGKGDLIGPRDV
jgi:hypothetical protein